MPVMSGNDVPVRLPIFPLPNVVLFPDALLPLHIFEPRYQAMTEDALEGNRLIGMVLLAPGPRKQRGRPPVYPVGCSGSITQADRLSDGRFNLVLQGLRRFRIQHEEASGTPYRVVTAELLEDPSFEELDSTAGAMLEGLRPELEEEILALVRKSAPDRVDLLRKRMASLDPVALVHTLASGLDCSMVEKQGLLETPDPLERCRLLLRLLQFREAERRLSNPPKIVN